MTYHKNKCHVDNDDVDLFERFHIIVLLNPPCLPTDLHQSIIEYNNDDVNVNVDLNDVYPDLNPHKANIVINTSIDDIIYQNIYNYVYFNHEKLNKSITKLVNLTKKQRRKVSSNYFNGYLYDKSISNLSSQHVIAMLQHYAYHGVLYAAINDVIKYNNQK